MNGREVMLLACAENNIDPEVGGAALRAFLDRLVAALIEGESITIRGLGKFETHTRGPTTRRNPGTGATVKVPQQQVLAFHASAKLRKMLNE